MDPKTAQQTPVSETPAVPTTPTTTVEATMPAPTSPAVPTPSQPSAPTDGAPVPASTAPVAPEAKKSSNKMWIIMIAIILVVLAVSGWFLYQYSMTKSADSMYPATTVSPTTVPSPTIGAVQSGDKQLDEQSQTIDENMMKADDDVKGVDSGLNDKSEDLSS